MAVKQAKKQDKPEYISREFPPATSAEEKEDQLTLLAMERVEMQIRDGTASSQILAHFLDRSSRKGRLEEDKLREEVSLVSEKTKSIKEGSNMSELFDKAIKAMRKYSGNSSEGDDDDESEDL